MDNPNTLSTLGNQGNNKITELPAISQKLKTKHNTENTIIFILMWNHKRLENTKNKKTKTKPNTKTKQEQKTNKIKTTWCNIMISERNKHLLAFAWQLLCSVIIRGKSCNDVLI
jgi:hypothetical protein